MARQPNIVYDSKKLDDAIREIDGDRYSATNIGSIVMGKGNTYYFNCLKKSTISEDALSRACKFYKLRKKDYIVPEQVKLEIINQTNPNKEFSDESSNGSQPIDANQLVNSLSEIIKPTVVDITPMIELMTAQNNLLSEFSGQQIKHMEEIVGQQKSTNYQLEQICNHLIKIKQQNESILKILQERESRFTNKNNSKRIG